METKFVTRDITGDLMLLKAHLGLKLILRT